MCKMLEDIREEAAIEKATENALNMLKNNIPLEKVAQYSGLSLDEIRRIKEEHNL